MKKQIKEIEKNPLEIKMTGKNGELDFYLYIRGDNKRIKKVISFLQDYLKIKDLK